MAIKTSREIVNQTCNLSYLECTAESLDSFLLNLLCPIPLLQIAGNDLYLR